MSKDILFAGAGYLIGAFTPGPLRIVKAWFTKKSTAAVAAVPATVVADVKSAASTVVADVKKL